MKSICSLLDLPVPAATICILITSLNDFHWLGVNRRDIFRFPPHYSYLFIQVNILLTKDERELHTYLFSISSRSFWSSRELMERSEIVTAAEAVRVTSNTRYPSPSSRGISNLWVCSLLRVDRSTWHLETHILHQHVVFLTSNKSTLACLHSNGQKTQVRRNSRPASEKTLNFSSALTHDTCFFFLRTTQTVLK